MLCSAMQSSLVRAFAKAPGSRWRPEGVRRKSVTRVGMIRNMQSTGFAQKQRKLMMRISVCRCPG